MKAVFLINTERGKERLVRGILSAKGFEAHTIPGPYNVLAEIKVSGYEEKDARLEEIKKIKEVKTVVADLLGT
ncbi:MAG: hypothetical protein A2835_01220 [Candidatus Niyogibacteria bacterium RIFCSPHIGHO2_01_FULL_45_28]|uniref:ACT domain-containing protein n=1 Tax=Candidatus Niyogibacteria bacterium RIFCSPLOWO2_02_FULL_45_13 TaxID=1801725 RepID=A0A1G2EZD7_9BACT|nr:MAG: hypothetical protein A2835_01220 [Candidatus Niyogibacteria bacterium RIFCSPHIGHO2_01_FULL_45_28]OGZ31145.1 MAG: hypothetical protein A3J00_01170 [Candidatus Niyogibacteria bacterium RIFCSPLOWO2_02_FULL_45_13]